MRMVIWLLACVSAVLSFDSKLSAGELVDRIVAVVNGEPVLHSEVEDKVRSGFIVTVSPFPAEEEDSSFEQALQDAVNATLIMQRAQEMEIEFSDADVEGEIQQNLQARGSNREGLLMALEREGITYESYKEDFRRQMVFRRFQGMVIRPMISISERDVQNYYLRQTGGATSSVQLTLRQIIIGLPAGALPDVAQGKQTLARDVYQKLRSGLDFAEAVRIYSDDPRARDTGGQMRNLRLDDLAPQIRQAVETLEVGEFSRPVETQLGYHIFLLEDKQFTGSADFARHRQRLETELLIIESELQTRRWLADERKRSEVRLIR